MSLLNEKPSRVPNGRGVFNRLGTPLDALQQTPGMDIEKIRGILDRLCRKISDSILSSRLESSLKKYLDAVSCHQRCWVMEERIFDKRVEMVLTLEEREYLPWKSLLRTN
jgi:hypothetical protein